MKVGNIVVVKTWVCLREEGIQVLQITHKLFPDIYTLSAKYNASRSFPEHLSLSYRKLLLFYPTASAIHP